MKSYLFLLAYVIICVYANHSPQHERCEILQSVADTDNAGNIVQCTVGQSCFSLDCSPVLLPNYEFRIYVEPCKTPASILINSTISGQEYSHEFTHSETIGLPVGGTGTPKIAVILNNDDNSTLVFSVQLIAPGLGNYTLVPETRFPLDNVTCVNGHVVTSSPPPRHTTTPDDVNNSCMETCVAIHRMVANTNSLCQATDNCLTINCKSPSTVQLFDVVSSYTIEPCESPPTILATFDDDANDLHYAQNITKDTSIPLNNFPLTPVIQVTLEDPDNFTILFGVNIIVLTQTIPLLPERRIPIDKTGCPGYTGPTVNPYCTTQQTTAGTSQSSDHTSVHTPTHTPVIQSTATTKHENNTHTPGVHDPEPIVGIVVGVVVLVIVVAVVSVIATCCCFVVAYFMMKRKSKGVYTYSHFQAMDEEDD